MKNKILLGVVIAMMLLSAVMVSAVSVSYSDSYLPKDKSTSGNPHLVYEFLKDKQDKENNGKKDMIKSKYEKVKITTDKFLGLFGGDPILDIELIDHTEVCTVDCYSILKADVYQNTKLIDALDTKVYYNGILSNSKISIETYILKDINTTVQKPVYQIQCHDMDTNFTNRPNPLTCEDIIVGTKSVVETKQEFVKYNNEEVSPGTYVIKIVGKKTSFDQVVDWVPTIQNTEITKLAWWNISVVYGNGNLGDVYFSTTTKNYSNMVLGVDYTTSGTTLYLMTNRIYNFSSLYLGPGTTLSTLNTTGAVIYLQATNNITLYGTINLSSKLRPGRNTNTFSFLGDSFSTPYVEDGGDAYGAGNGTGFQGSGFGGGGAGGYPTVIYAGDIYASGNGSNGTYPFGSGGTRGAVNLPVTPNVAHNKASGTNGVGGGGGGGGAAANKDQATALDCYGGYGGGSYGADGTGGSTNFHGDEDETMECYSPSGGGAGGSAGIPGISLVLRAKTLNIYAPIDVSGTSGQKGGGGSTYLYQYNQFECEPGGCWDRYHYRYGGSGYPGGGGGGAGSGDVKLYYRNLVNSSALNIAKSAGNGGFGGNISQDYYESNYHITIRYAFYYEAEAGTTSTDTGVVTLNQEGYSATTLLTPANGDSVVLTPIVNFTAYTIPTSVTLVNATFFLWVNNTGALNNTQTTTLSGTSPVNLSWGVASANFPDGVYKWGVRTCWTDGTVPKCEYTNNNTFSTFTVQFVNKTVYNNVTYEMLNETFIMNASSTGFFPLSAKFVWDDITEYGTTNVGGTQNASFVANLIIPIGAGIHTIHWHVDYGGQIKQTPFENITVLNSQYNICNFTNGSSLNITYLTINYRDETTNLPINATVINSVWNYNITGNGNTYGEQIIYGSPLVNGTVAQHQFCFIPSFAPIVINANYQYGNPTLGYSTKLWPFMNLPLTNASTTMTLYLISLVDSGTSPVTFQAINSQTSVVIGGVRVQIYRDISGTPVLVDDGYTDTAGTVSYYLSPITAYTVVASSPDCNTLTSTITPTSNQYNLQLSCTNAAATNFVSQLEGITYQRTPADGIAAPGTLLYTYYVNSALSNLTRVKFQLVDAVTNSVLATNDSLTNVAGCSSSSCKLTLTYTTFTGDNVKGRYYVAINGTADSDLVLIEGDAYWRFIIINKNNSVNSIGRFMINIQDFFDTWGTSTPNCIIYKTESVCNSVTECKWINETIWAPSSSIDYQESKVYCVARDDLNKTEFNRIVTIFFFFAVFLFILGRTTGYELNHPGAFVVGMSAVIWILSLYGMFTFAGLTEYEFFNQYIFALSTSCIGLGYVISVVRRYSG